MSDILQMVYASRATFGPSAHGGTVEPEVGRILMQSRRNNPRRGLVGALYYGDGCFFQCLEGSPEAIGALFAQLQDDPRHTDVRVLRRQFIGSTSFSGWSMKYVPAASDVRTLLAIHGKDRFDPYDFDDALLDAMVTLLHTRADDGLNPISAPAAAGATRPPTPAVVPSRGLGFRLALVALAVAAVAAAALLLR